MGVGIFNELIVVPHLAFAECHSVAPARGALARATLESPFKYMSAIFGCTLIAIALLVSGIHLGLGIGGMERMVLYPAITFGIGLGGYLMADGSG